MKYIRTKDKIYETCENGETYNGFGCKTKEGIIKIHKKDIVKQADTIEELCDEFVAINYGTSSKPIPLNVNMFETIKSIAKEYEVKGAIWTDKGLIYVAKMNKEGELELL